MSKLIEALQILLKYGDPEYPTNCSHDQLAICGIDPANVSAVDKEVLEGLGFIISEDSGEEVFISFRYGSC